MEKIPRRVLIADDEAVVCTVLRRMLAALFGREADAVSDGEAAVTAVAVDPARYGVVLLDVSMPGPSAEDVVTRIRDVAPSLPIILMSGHDPHVIEERFASFAISAILSKPFERRELDEALRRVLGESPDPAASRGLR